MSCVLGYFIDFNKDFKFLTSLRIDNLKLRNFYHQKIAVSYIKKTCSWETLFTQHIPSNTGRPREIIEIPRGFGVLLSTKGWKGSRGPQGILEILGFPGRPGGPEGYLGFLKYHESQGVPRLGPFPQFPLFLISDSSMSWSTRFVYLKLRVEFSVVDFVLFLLKFIFLFNEMHGPFNFKT